MAQYPPPSYSYAPPPYSSQPQFQQAQQYTYTAGTPQPSQFYPGAQGMMAQGPPPPYTAYQHAYSVGYPTQHGYSIQQSHNAVAQFDSGARFDGIATQHIPPPPPGCAPNAAQMTVAQGGTVLATQKKASWFTGGSGGGVSFW